MFGPMVTAKLITACPPGLVFVRGGGKLLRLSRKIVAVARATLGVRAAVVCMNLNHP
jgi:hypothetical protein